MSQVVPMPRKLPKSSFRLGTTAKVQDMNFVLVQGGLGDFIGYLSAIVYIAKEYRHVVGHVYCYSWFKEIAENVLSPYPEWKVKDVEEPLVQGPGFAPMPQPINRSGAHAVDLGFIYYLNLTPPPPEANFYPELDLYQLRDLGLPKKRYVVMTPVSSNVPKTMRPETFNGIKNWLLEAGFMPLFLGNPDFRKGSVSLHPDYDLSGGVNLLGQTSLIGAAGIMSKASAVIGLDNGLLHLASMTKVPLVYGYTVSSVEHTRPRRRSGVIYDILPDIETLPCTFCQSRMRLFANHDFKNCLYEDTKCLDVISDPKVWTNALERVIDA